MRIIILRMCIIPVNSKDSNVLTAYHENYDIGAEIDNWQTVPKYTSPGNI